MCYCQGIKYDETFQPATPKITVPETGDPRRDSISRVLGSVAAEGAEGTTGGEASDDSSITVVQIGQNGEYLGTARLPAQTEGTGAHHRGSCRTESLILPAAGEGGLRGLPLALGSLVQKFTI